MRVAHHLVLLSVSLRAAAAFVAVAPPRRTRVEAHYVRMLDASLATTAATEVAPLLEYPNLLSGVDTLWSDMFSICAIATLGLMGAYATQVTFKPRLSASTVHRAAYAGLTRCCAGDGRPGARLNMERA